VEKYLEDPLAEEPVFPFLICCNIFNLVPNIKTYVDRGTLLSRHRDTIAGPRIYLDDFFLLRFVLRAEDKSRKIRALFEIVDDHPFDLCSERSQDVR